MMKKNKLFEIRPHMSLSVFFFFTKLDNLKNK